MGCINSTKMVRPPKEMKKKLSDNQRLILLIMQGNLHKLKKFVFGRGVQNIDFTSVQGSLRAIKIDELTFETSNWGPVLLAIEANH